MIATREVTRLLNHLGFVLRRAGAQRVVLAAALATILLATTVLAMTGLYAGSVTVSGLQRALAGAPLADRAMQVTEAFDEAETFRTRDAEVRAALAEAFAVVGADVYGSAVSSSYALPDQPGRHVTDLTVFAFYDGLVERVTLVDGAWPRPAPSGPVAAALPQPAARELGVSPGDELEVVNRLSDEPVLVSVSGTYSVDDPTDAYWLGDNLVDGMDVTSSFTTNGPLVVPRSTFLDRFAPDATARWRVDPELGDLAVADLPALRAAVADLDPTSGAGTIGGDALAESGIDELLAGIQTPLVVARSAVTMPVTLLVILAGYTLVLATRLLGEHRARETALLRARGVSSRQLVASALRETLVLTVPAALLAPWLAAWLLRGFDASAPLAGAGVQEGLGPQPSTWLIAAVVAAGATAVMVAPVWWQGETGVTAGQSRGRQSLRSGLQRVGGDLVLAAVAALAYWQLTRYGSPVLADVTGRLAVDPLLVLAPALILLAGSVLTLRLVPLVAAGAERLVARGRGATAALGTWQLSRRPRRYSGPAVLLVMATAVGAFSVTYAAAWSRSQEDQADFATGADLRLVSTPATVTADDFEQVPGVTAKMPLARERASFGDLSATVLAVDAASAADVLVLRPDLARRPLAALTAPLLRARPDVPAFDVPPRATTIVLPLRLATRGPYDPQVGLSAVVRDRLGVLHRVSLGTPLADSRTRAPTIDLAGFDEPVRLVAVEVRHQSFIGAETAGEVDDTVRLRVGVPVARAADGTSLGPLVAPRGTRWQVSFDRNSDIPSSVEQQGRRPDRPVRAALDAGYSSPVLFSVALAEPGETPARSAVPALVSADLADSLGGKTLALSAFGGSVRLRVAGVLDGVPTVDPAEAAAVLVDLPTVSALAYQQARSVPTVDEWWLNVPATDTARAVRAIRDDQDLAGADLLVRTDAGADLRADPVGVGIVGALAIGFLAAAAFAAIGFAVSAAVSVRERHGEFALLRAVGTGSRQLVRGLALEQAVLIGIGVGVGLLLGVTVARLVAPLVTLTAQAARPFPAVLVPLPWWRLGLLGLALVAVLALVLLVLGALLSRRVFGAAPRLGEDT